MKHLLLCVLCLCTWLQAQPSLAGPRLFPRGARAAGIEDVRLDRAHNAYLFTLRDLEGQARVEYRLPLTHPSVVRGVLRIEETTTGVLVMAGGGLSYRTTDPPPGGLGRWITPQDLAFSPLHGPRHTGTILSHSLDPFTGTVTLRIRDDYRTGTATIRTEKIYRIRLRGKSLEITALADEGLRRRAAFNYVGFVFGTGDGLRAPARALHIPYMDMVSVFMGADGVFVSRFLDWYQSHGSTTTSVKPGTQGRAFWGETGSGVYRNDAHEWNAPVRDVAYLTVSRDIEDTFPVIDRPPSEYRLLTADRAVSQNGPSHAYATSTAWVRRAVSLGLDDMIHIKWDWHKWPFNLNDPDFFRPAPALAAGNLWGTEKEWLEFANTTAAADWALAPYFTVNMMDPGYPNLRLLLPGSRVGSVLLTANPAHDPSRATHDAAGALKKGWDTNANLARTNLKGQGHRVDVIGPHLHAANLRAFAARIQGAHGFPVAGLHIDAQTEIPGWIQIDQRKGSAFSHTIAETLRDRERSFRAGKDGMQGPLMGENGHWRYRSFASYAAGLLDGTSRKIPIHWDPPSGPPSATNWDAPVIPDYELTEVIPKATAFFGMGWETHFKSTPFPVPDSWIDAWQTTLLSFGHAPYFGTNGDVRNNYWDWQGTVRSYHLLHGVSSAMRRSRVSEIRYVDASGTERTLAAALVASLDLRHPRLVLRFANGLEFKANHAASLWTTKVKGTSFTIPQDGFVAVWPGGGLALSAINPASGRRVDYALEPGVSEMIDRRGVAQSFHGFPGALLPIPPGLFQPRITELDLVVVKDRRHHRVIYAQDFKTASRALGPAPTIKSLQIAADDTTTLSLGRLRLGLRALATDVRGHVRDVTGLVRWSSSNQAVAGVNGSGGLAAVGPGRTMITAVLGKGGLRASRFIAVNAHPVLGAVRLDALGQTAALLSVTSDSHAPLAVLFYRRIGTTRWRLALGRADPPGKWHRFTLSGLRAASGYQVVPAAMNDLFLIGTGPVSTFKTQ